MAAVAEGGAVAQPLPAVPELLGYLDAWGTDGAVTQSQLLNACGALIAHQAFDPVRRVLGQAYKRQQGEGQAVAPDLNYSLGVALAASGDHESASQHFLEAETGYRKQEERFLAAVSAAASLLELGRPHPARSLLVLYLRASESGDLHTDDSDLLVFAYSVVGRALYKTGMVPEAAECVKSALTIAPDTNDAEQLGRLNQTLGALHNEMSNFSLACAFHECALEHYRTLGSAEGEALVCDNLGYALAMLKRHGEAIRALETAVQIWKREDNVRRHVLTLERLGSVHFQMGNYESALVAFQDALRLAAGRRRPRTRDRLRAKVEECWKLLQGRQGTHGTKSVAADPRASGYLSDGDSDGPGDDLDGEWADASPEQSLARMYGTHWLEAERQHRGDHDRRPPADAAHRAESGSDNGRDGRTDSLASSAYDDSADGALHPYDREAETEQDTVEEDIAPAPLLDTSSPRAAASLGVDEDDYAAAAAAPPSPPQRGQQAFTTRIEPDALGGVPLRRSSSGKNPYQGRANPHSHACTVQ